MLISIRSTNGGGKSTVARGLFSHTVTRPKALYGLIGPRSPEAYELKVKEVKKPVHLLGPYETPTGGVDCVQPYDHVLTLIEKYAKRGHVVFEGVIVSSSYGRVGRLMETFGQDAVMAFLDTSLEQCIENVKKRRGARADAREFNPKNLTSKYNQIVKSRVKIAEEGKLRVVDLNFGKGLEQVLALLRSAK